MKFVYAVLLVSLAVSGSAIAQNSSVQTSEAVAPAPLPWTFNMKLNADGPRFNAMDGADGLGTRINVKDAFRLGYKLDKNWALEVTPAIAFRSGNRKGAGALEVMDPYFGVKRADIFGTKAQGYDLYAEGRYYVPVSAETKRDIGTERDKGNGQAMGRLIFSQSILDGRMKAVAEYDYRKNFSERLKAKVGVTQVHEVYGWLNMPVSETVTPYVSYKNIMNRYISGLGDPWVKNHTVGFGAKWQATKSLSIDPYVDSPFMLKDSTVKLEAVYVFI